MFYLNFIVKFLSLANPLRPFSNPSKYLSKIFSLCFKLNIVQLKDKTVI